MKKLNKKDKERDRAMGKPVDDYQPLFKKLHKQFPAKNPHE